MTDTNWPNPEQPGVPMFPERKAWHMLDRNVWEWCPSRQAWNDTVLHPNFVKAKAMAWRKYQGIVLTHTQITELQTADSERLDWLEDGCCDVRFRSEPIADTGDADTYCDIIEHHMAEPKERIIGSGETVRAAINSAWGKEHA